jgi:hypothetical protein
MRYVLSCMRCEFSADATDLRGLGSQLITHALSCHGDPLLALEGKQDEGGCMAEELGKTNTAGNRDASQVPLCA